MAKNTLRGYVWMRPNYVTHWDRIMKMRMTDTMLINREKSRKIHNERFNSEMTDRAEHRYTASHGIKPFEYLYRSFERSNARHKANVVRNSKTFKTWFVMHRSTVIRLKVQGEYEHFKALIVRARAWRL